VLACAAAASTASPRVQAANKAGDIQVGVIEMLTGGSGYYGQVLTDGIKLAASQINAKGGIKGQKIKLVVEDNASDDAQTVTLTRKLGGDSKNVAIIGPTYLNNLKAGQVVANQIGIPYIAGQGLLSPPGQKWSFKDTIPFEAYQVAAVTAIVKALGAKTIGTVYNQQNPAQTLVAQLDSAQLKKIGVKEVAKIGVNEAQSDYGPQIAKLVSEKPDAILINLTTEDGARFMFQARSRGVKQQFIGLAGGGLADNRIYELSKGNANGMISTDDVSPSAPKTIAYTKAYAAMFHKTFTDKLSTYGYDAMWLLANAMQRAPKIDRESIRKALEALPACPQCVHNYLHAKGGHDFVEQRTYFIQLTPKGFISWPKQEDALVCKTLKSPGCH
jgi:branched-chain amino acid transport system substrate-binding protein